MSIPLSAFAATVSDQITVTEDVSTVIYGDVTPTFRAQVTVPSDDPPLVSFTSSFYLILDSVTSLVYTGDISGTYPNYSMTVKGLGPPVPALAAGQHSVVAQYRSPNHGLLTSAPVVFTVLRKTPLLECGINNVSPTYALNASLTFLAAFMNTQAPPQFENGTFTVTFVGAQTFTSGNLKPDGQGQFNASAPPAAGIYETKCAFSGSSSFSPVEITTSAPTIVSANNRIGGIALYTDPTPVTAGTPTTWKVVITGKAGLPTPTGYISLVIAGATTQVLQLGSGGSLTFQARAPALSPSATIQVNYNGDPVYAFSNAKFALTTQPITSIAPTPAVTPTTTGRLAQTGGGIQLGTAMLGLLLILAGVIGLGRRRERSGRS
jgi:hypothetical protein